MTYQITGLSPEPFAELFTLDDDALAARNAIRVTAKRKPGYPCRVTLEDAEPGEALILFNHVSHDGSTPYRASHAIYIRENASASATYIDRLPPIMATRTLSLRGFDSDGMMLDACVTEPGQSELGITRLFADDTIAYIHAHNAARGCFAARIDRT